MPLVKAIHAHAPSRPPIRVVLVDDHMIITDMVTAALEDDGVAVVVGTAARLDGVATMIAEVGRAPEVALVDYVLSDGRGTAAITQIRRAWPNCRTILFTGVTDHDVMEEAIAAGADGILKKTARAGEVIVTVERAAAGEVLLDPTLLAALVRRAAAGAFRAGSLADPLTPRERSVLEILLEVGETEAAAARLGITASTFRVHLHNAMHKLGATGRLEAISRALKAGIIRPPTTLLGDAVPETVVAKFIE